MARPVEFNREEVLDQAMVCFWKGGYEATSISDLVAATKLKPGSLYAAFDSKQKLFLLTLERYSGTSLQRIEECFSQAPSPLDGIEQFLLQLGQDCNSDDEGRGCLLVNSLLEFASADATVHEQVRGYLDRVEALLGEQLQRALDAGELVPGRTAKERASLLVTGIWGMRVMSARRPAMKSYQDVADQLLEAIKG